MPLLRGTNLIVKLDFVYFTAGSWLAMNWTENAIYRPVCGNTSKQTRDWRGEDR